LLGIIDKPILGPFHFNSKENDDADDVFWYSTKISWNMLKPGPTLIVANDPDPTSENRFVPLILRDANSLALEVVPNIV
jgi:hypothetical protein